MRICVSGTISTGKTTYINDFLEAWPMYKLCELSYRKSIRNNKMPHSTQGTEETQKFIQDAIIDDVIMQDRTKNVIFDRGIFDNLAHTLYLHSKGKVGDEFCREAARIARESMKFYDIIFFMPVLDSYPVEMDENNNDLREHDETYRADVDLIMKAIQQDYLRPPGEARMFFPNYDAPALIEIFGNRRERIAMTQLYIKKNGKSYGEKDSLILNALGKPTKEVNG